MNDRERLFEAAKGVWGKSYAPYSKFHVAAAVLSDGEIFTGVNVENISYGLTICAERTAIFSMATRGLRKIDAILVMTKTGKTPPCGACRQVMAEFGDDFPVYMASPEGIKSTTTLKEILPDAFVDF